MDDLPEGDERLEQDLSDDLLPYHSSATERDAACASSSCFPTTSGTSRLSTASLIVLGFFFATCPIPRKYMGASPLRQLLIVLIASLITLPPPLHRRLLGNPKRMIRVAVSYAGLFISLYALFGASDEIHIETRLRSLVSYRQHEGHVLGYFTRLILLTLGYFIQKKAGMHSTNRILGTYILCLAWIYSDAPMTLIDLARQREHW